MTLQNYNFDLAQRYQLLAQASYTKTSDAEHVQWVSELKNLIERDLVQLALEGCPPNFPEILKMFQLELDRFEAFCAFPYLAQKNIVGIGGAFSAGKSSFLNTLLGRKKLVVQVDPTTSVPTYLILGDQDKSTAINIFNREIHLKEEDFLSFTHEEYEQFGSEVSGLLKSLVIQDTSFKWGDLALLDTPGYSNTNAAFNSERTDTKVAFSQLNTAHFIIWVVSAANGTISDEDLNFLGELNPSIPKLIVLSRADLKTKEDLYSIKSLILDLTQKRGIEIIDVVFSSARKKREYPLERVEYLLFEWNKVKRPILFAQNFKKLFLQYERFLDEQIRIAQMQINRINRIEMLSDLPEILNDVDSLKIMIQEKFKQILSSKETLSALQKYFFDQLNRVGQKVGIPLLEPDELELIEVRQVDLVPILKEILAEKDIDLALWQSKWELLSIDMSIPNVKKILRQTPKNTKPIWSNLMA
ncbi:dynamin family protein [Acinetobacter lwoffii]|jgi:GTP-binding protein EngB required for normal cell division|uniref:dynamin family protein n=1 Tax=Acinetobacter lwoffii TaxID=28090 RepID=UPI002097843A|nr:dynamin family protein [Acinetobacter lwoffii]MCO8069824.1 dynamin family protein [Acinetobacter lwoffii]